MTYVCRCAREGYGCSEAFAGTIKITRYWLSPFCFKSKICNYLLHQPIHFLLKVRHLLVYNTIYHCVVSSFVDCEIKHSGALQIIENNLPVFNREELERVIFRLMKVG